MSKKSSSPRDTKYALKAEFVTQNLQHLEGKILTIIDASIAEPTQNKALKDLIRNEFSDKWSWIFRVASGAVENLDDPDMLVEIK